MKEKAMVFMNWEEYFLFCSFGHAAIYTWFAYSVFLKLSYNQVCEQTLVMYLIQGIEWIEGANTRRWDNPVLNAGICTLK